MAEKKTLTDKQAMEMMLECGIPIVNAVHTALKTDNQARSLGAVINILRNRNDHVALISGCIGAIAGLLLAVSAKEDT